MLQRKTTGSIVCPRCGRLISANARECIHCGRKNPGLWGFGPGLRKILGENFGVASYIIGACVFLYAIAILMDPAAVLQHRSTFSFLAPSNWALDRLGMTGAFAIAGGRWWTLLTAIYLHAGVLHILFNMLWLNQLGQIVQELFGTSRMFLIFTVSGVLGFLLSGLFSIPFTVGASGAIFGLLGALIYYGRFRGGQFGAAIYRQVGVWALVLFLFGFMSPAVNNIAHAGGFIGGYLAAMLMGYQERRLETLLHRRLAALVAILTVAAFLIEVLSSH